MLGVFYAYTEEYEQNDKAANLHNMCKTKLRKTSKCLWPVDMDVCCEMNVFFRRFNKSLSENP